MLCQIGRSHHGRSLDDRALRKERLQALWPASNAADDDAGQRNTGGNQVYLEKGVRQWVGPTDPSPINLYITLTS